MGRYRKKSVEIEAVRWTGYNHREIEPLANFDVVFLSFIGDDLHIHTLEGDMRADIGDWIIKGVKGELYPCKPEIFDATYESVAKSEEVS